MAGSLWSLSTGLPWQLLQDSMVSADKEEEEAVSKKESKAQEKEKEKKKKKKRKTPNSKISYTILFFNLNFGRMLIVYSLVLQQVYCIIASKLTKLSWMPWHAGLTVSRQHHLLNGSRMVKGKNELRKMQLVKRLPLQTDHTQ